MKPQKALPTCLTALLLFAFIVVPLSSGETTAKSMKIISGYYQERIGNESSKKAANASLQILGNNPTRQDKQKNDNKNENNGDHEQAKTRHHADEEKHKNHLYHYNRIRHKRKTVESIACICMKIFVALSYIAILLGGYVHLGH